MVAWTRIDQHRYCAWKIIKKLGIASIIEMPTKSNLLASSNNKELLKLRSEDLIISAS